MSVLHTTLVFLAMSTIAWQDTPLADESPSAVTAKEFPRSVVAGWLELHRTGQQDAAAALTTGNPHHQARHLLPATRVAGVHVVQSLGNARAAAVVTSALEDSPGGEQVLLFWLVRSQGHWRINKSESLERRIADERLRGFLEAGDVRWHVRRDELLGQWESGPCRPPAFPGIACGSRLKLNEDSQFRLAVWGPAGPPEDAEGDEIKEGKWQLTDGTILLSHQQEAYECRVVWMEDNLLVLESPDGKSRVPYHRADNAD